MAKKAMANLKAFAHKQTDRRTDGQRTGQRLYDPSLLMRGA